MLILFLVLGLCILLLAVILLWAVPHLIQQHREQRLASEAQIERRIALLEHQIQALRDKIGNVQEKEGQV